MKRKLVSALTGAALVACSGAAKATDNLDEQIAALQKENIALKKTLLLDTLQKENADLRKRLHVGTHSNAKPDREVVRDVSHRDDPAVAANAMAHAPARGGTPVNKASEYYPPERQVFAQRWSGPYVGGHVGMGFGNWQSSEVPTFAPPFATITSQTLDLNALGAIAGGHAGYSWQLGSFVFGPEADVSVSTVGKAAPRTLTFAIPGFGFTNTQMADASIEWFSSFRGRVGFASDNWLFFGSGGLAVAGVSNAVNGLNLTTKEDKTIIGYVVGGGLSYAIGPQVALRAEYLRYQFPDTNQAISPVGQLGAGQTATTYLSTNMSTNVVRAGFDLRFQ